jgi:chemosensory pili system protein ChpA (sensor histidine kinase/response regulator)
MKTILVVEDFLHARQLICKKLRSKGYHTRSASSVQEAYEVLSHEAGDINLVLSDVDVPSTNGFDLLRTIKNNPETEDIPVVFWTAQINSDKIRFARETGVAPFIQKPFRDDIFFKEIDRAINTKGSMINLAS